MVRYPREEGGEPLCSPLDGPMRLSTSQLILLSRKPEKSDKLWYLFHGPGLRGARSPLRRPRLTTDSLGGPGWTSGPLTLYGSQIGAQRVWDNERAPGRMAEGCFPMGVSRAYLLSLYGTRA